MKLFNFFGRKEPVATVQAQGVPSKKSQFERFKSVAIFGSADIPKDHPVYVQAYEAAQHLADAGVTVVNGGGPGVMRAATDGAKSRKGSTLTVSFAPVDAPFFEGRASDNFPDTEIKAATYPERLLGLLEHSDAFVVVKGGTGTLSEWATIWLMAHIYYGNHKPFVLVGSYWQEVVDVIAKHFFIDEREVKVFRIVDRADQVVAALQDLEKELAVVQQEMTEHFSK